MRTAFSDEDEVPLEVLLALAEDTSLVPLLSTQGTKYPESVVFCEPARLRNGLSLSFLLCIFVSSPSFCYFIVIYQIHFELCSCV
jgi:hypothetical protein